MIYPIVHTNGTSREVLYAQTEAALEAVSGAIRVLREAAPHSRDYYPLGPEAFPQAHEQFRAQWDHLKVVQTELYNTLEYLADLPR